MFDEKTILYKLSNGFKSIIRTLPHRKEPFVIGLINLNVVVQTPMMVHVLVVQLKWLLQKTKKKILKLVISDRKLKLREIAVTVKISEGSVLTIIHDHLTMRKLFSKWVQRLLTIDQKQQRVDDSEQCLAMFTRNK